MTKEEILKNITDDEQRKSVSTFLDFAENAAKSAEMTADKFNEMFESKANELEIETAKVKGLQEQLDKMGSEISAMKENAPEEKHVSLTDAFKEQIEANKEKIEAGAKFKMQVPAELVSKTITASSITSDTAALRDEQVGQLFRGQEFLRNLFRVRTVGENTHGTYRWWEQSSVTDNSSNVSEGADAASESTAAWEEKSLTGKRINAWSKVTKDQLKDVNWMRDEVITILQKSMRLKENSQLLSGTGAATYIKGLETYSTAFASADSPTYKKATLQDLISACKTQVSRKTYGGGVADTVIISPNRMDELRSAKDDNGNYVNQMWAIGGNVMIHGLNIVENALVDDSDMYVFDSKLAQLLVWDNLTVEVGQINDDFTNGIFTMNAYMRENLLIKDVDTEAFVFVDDIDTEIAAITVAEA